MWTYKQGNNGPVLHTEVLPVLPNHTLEKHLIWLSLSDSLSVCLYVCLIDHPTTIALPEIAVRDYLFGEPHLFFKWPYLSLKMRHLGTMRGGNVLVFKLSVYRCQACCHQGTILSLRTLGISCLVLLAGGVSIMSRLLCLKMLPSQCRCQI